MGRKKEGTSIFFIDSDTELTSAIVQECVDKIQNEDAKPIIVLEISVGEGFWGRRKASEKECHIGDDRIKAGRFFDKDAFFKVGKWNEDMIGTEDWDLTSRIRTEGFKVDRIHGLIKHHEGNLGLIETLKSKY